MRILPIGDQDNYPAEYSRVRNMGQFIACKRNSVVERGVAMRLYAANGRLERPSVGAEIVQQLYLIVKSYDQGLVNAFAKDSLQENGSSLLFKIDTFFN